jgi:hypothetical protein
MEIKNRALIGMHNFMLVNSKLRTSLWEETLLTTCHKHNIILSRKLKVYPDEL